MSKYILLEAAPMLVSRRTAGPLSKMALTKKGIRSSLRSWGFYICQQSWWEVLLVTRTHLKSVQTNTDWAYHAADSNPSFRVAVLGCLHADSYCYSQRNRVRRV